jgi:hypothetical protein
MPFSRKEKARTVVNLAEDCPTTRGLAKEVHISLFSFSLEMLELS